MRVFLGVCHSSNFIYANFIEYSFVIPHDMETLVEFMGGPETFEARLDLMVLSLICRIRLMV